MATGHGGSHGGHCAQGWVGRKLGLVSYNLVIPYDRESADQYGRDSRVGWIRSGISSNDLVERVSCPDLLAERKKKRERKTGAKPRVRDGKYMHPRARGNAPRQRFSVHVVPTLVRATAAFARVKTTGVRIIRRAELS